MVTSLGQLKPGDQATVVGYADPTSSYARHLTSLGLIPGTELRMTRRAPLGTGESESWRIWRYPRRRRGRGVPGGRSARARGGK